MDKQLHTSSWVEKRTRIPDHIINEFAVQGVGEGTDKKKKLGRWKSCCCVGC